jgi:hypothetical protein
MPTKSKSSARSVRKSPRQTEPATAEAAATGLATGTASSFKIGDRVTHHMFGDGNVEAVRASAGQETVVIVGQAQSSGQNR